MKIGFTGTRDGMSNKAKDTVYNVLEKYKPDEVHHGNCIGADGDFINICVFQVKIPYIIAHPGMSYFSNVVGPQTTNISDEYKKPDTHFKRNRTIVDSTDLLIAVPKKKPDATEQGGGTWYTINYARKKQKPIIIVWPDGSTQEENVK